MTNGMKARPPSEIDSQRASTHKGHRLNEPGHLVKHSASVVARTFTNAKCKANENPWGSPRVLMSRQQVTARINELESMPFTSPKPSHLSGRRNCRQVFTAAIYPFLIIQSVIQSRQNDLMNVAIGSNGVTRINPGPTFPIGKCPTRFFDDGLHRGSIPNI